MSPDARHLLRLALLAPSLLGSVSCYSPAKSLPPAQAEAMAWAEEAETAFHAGRYTAAQQRYKAALDLHIAASNTPGIIRNLVNLGVVQHTAGQNAAAHQSLAALDRQMAADASSVPHNAEMRHLLAEARWLKAHMLLDEGRLQEAQQVLDHADGFSGSSRLLNLRAKLLLAQKRPAEAAVFARKAWKAAKDDPLEQADAARYQARAAGMLGRHAEASHWYQIAVPLDQSASRQHLVADDWLGMARASQQMDRGDETRHFARLALDAARQAGDQPRQREAQQLLRSS